MKCNSCGSGMKPLFTGFYCPNDCDRGGKPRVMPATFTRYDGKQAFLVSRHHTLVPYLHSYDITEYLYGFISAAYGKQYTKESIEASATKLLIKYNRYWGNIRGSVSAGIDLLHSKIGISDCLGNDDFYLFV